MGQKANPNLLRIGITKTWKTELFEKKNKELSDYIIKDLNIKDYVKRVFEKHGLIVHEYKAFYNQPSIDIYVSYYITPNFLFSSINKTDKIKLTELKKDPIKPKKKRFIIIDKKQFKKSCDKVLLQDFCKLKNKFSIYDKHKTTVKTNKNLFYKLKKNYSYYIDKVKEKKLNHYKNKTKNFVIKKKQKIKINDYENLNQLKFQSIIKKLLQSLTIYTKKQFNISLTFNCLNKNTNLTKKQTQVLKKNLLSLQKFKNSQFFKEGVDVIFEVIKNKESSSILNKFIALQMKTVKRHKFLFSFLKKTITLFINTNFSKIKGVQINIKGRLNGAPRAKHKIITIGDVPIHTLSSKINYSQKTIHNNNGSYGIKVWVVDK